MRYLSSNTLYSLFVLLIIFITGNDGHGNVRIATQGKTLIFGNNFIERHFAADSWQTTGLYNFRTGTEYSFDGADDVVLEFADITDIHQMPEQVETVPLRKFRYLSREVQDLPGGGKELVFTGEWQGIQINIRYELHPEWFYMKKRIDVKNVRPEQCFLLTVYLESLKNQFAGKHLIDVMTRPMNYKPIHRSEDCFMLMEYPGGMEALFDMKYFPGRFLAPGEQYTSYPAVVGMTSKNDLEFELRKYAYEEMYWYPGSPPHNYGVWIIHLNWDGTPENIYPHLRKSAEMGMDIFIVDARLDAYKLRSNEEEQWLEYQLPERERFPDGLEGFLEQTRLAGLQVGYYLRTSQLIRRRKSWMIDHPMLADRFKTHPPLESGNYVGESSGSCFAYQPYDNYFETYTLNLIKNYESDFFHFDWFTSYPCTQPHHNHLPNGWDAVDKQHEAFMRILMEMRRENPSIVLQSGGGCLSVQWMKWLSHSFIHDIWPGPVPDLSYTRSCGTDSRERLHRYAKDGLSPMMMISDWTDAGGDLMENPYGWKDSFMNSIALTPSLRLEAGLYSYGHRELAWMKQWMKWRSDHTEGYANVRFLWGHPYERGTEGYAFLENSQGYLYFVNNEYADHEVSVVLDETIGISGRDTRYRVQFLYPEEAVLTHDGRPFFRYGDKLELFLPFKSIRYVSVFPESGRTDLPEIQSLPLQSDRWVVGTKRVNSKQVRNVLEYSAGLSLSGKALPEEQIPAASDADIKLFTGLVDENPAGRIYLLLYGEEPVAGSSIIEQPFPGLKVWVNERPVGGTVKSTKRPWQRRRKDQPYFYGDVTGLVSAGNNTIRWMTDSGSVKMTEAILVRDTDEQFPEL